MTLTILIDLDDTLLEDSTEKFIPAYLDSFCLYLAPHTNKPELVFPALMSATEEMRQNTDPSKLLKEVFDQAFYVGMEWNYDKIYPLIEDYYQTIYPEFRKVTSPNPANPTLIQELKQRNATLVVATNPIFPDYAIHQRLDWSNLGDEKLLFDLITSYEEMHFTKPHLEYFAETLGRVGWPEGPVVMIGDSLASDIQPAVELGLPVYWVGDHNDYTQLSGDAPIGGGSLDQFLSWLDLHTPETLTPEFNAPSASIATLRSTPAVFQTLVTQSDHPAWTASSEDGGWNLTEIFCHLRDVDKEIYLPRIQHVIEQDRPFLEAVDADTWAAERNYKQQDGPQAFIEFVIHRLDLLDLIDKLPQDAKEKEIRHTIFGPTSLAELLKISARHDKLHIQQVQSTLFAFSG